MILGPPQICEGGGIELYVDIETYIAFRCTLLRELGGSTVHAFGRSSSTGRICRTGLDSRVAGDAAGEHRHSARWHSNTASRDYDAAEHAGDRVAQRNSKHDGSRIEFTGDSYARQHDTAVHRQPQYPDESG